MESMLKPSLCPTCGALLDDATSATREKTKPIAGDLSVCFYCGELLIFTATLTVTQLDDATKRKVLNEAPETWELLLDAQQHVRRRKHALNEG